MKRIQIFSLKRNDYLSDLYKLLNEFNIDSSNLLKNLKESKPFVITIKESISNEEFIKKLEEIANFKVDDIEREDFSKSIDRWGILTILILDIFTVLVISEIIFKNIDVYNILLNIVPIQRVSIIFITLIKLFLIFVLIKGVLGIFNTTLWGYMFKVGFTGNPKNLITFIMLPVFGFYMINIGFGIVYQYFGLFMIVFFVVSIFTAYEHIGVGFRKS